MTTPVNFNLAKLLKEEGFTFSQKETYYNPVNGCTNFEEITPTISEVVMWLYEKHGIWIVINITITNKWYFELFNLKEKRNAELETPEKYFNSSTEAYEAAIEYTLNNLI